MDSKKIITLTIIGIIAIAISLTITQLFIRKEKLNSEAEGKVRTSYAILFSTWIIAFTLLNLKSLTILSEAIDLINKTNMKNPILEISKSSILFIGLTNIWLIIWYMIASVFSTIFIGKRISAKEIENNNFPYFIMKGILSLSFIWLLMPIFEMLLRTFLPSIEIPFYR